MTDLLKLAERCEAATGRDHRKLLSEAFRAVFGGPECVHIDRWPGYASPRWDGFFTMLDAEAYLDAAMTLVPEEWRWIMREACPDKSNPNERGFFARLETRDFESVTWGKGSDWLTDVVAGQDVFCWAATPALALCAAALRARSEAAAVGGR